MIETQGIEFRCHTGEVFAVFREAAFNQVDVHGVVGFGHYMGDVLVHNLAGDVNPHQARQVALDLVAQATQGVGAAFVDTQTQFFEGDIHLATGGNFA